MRVVSLNAWGGQVWPALSDWLGGLGADVLCLQEVTRAPVPGGPDWLVYRDAERRLDQRADLFADVSARLPGHQGYFAAAARGTLQDGAGTAYLSEHGIAVWTHRRLAVTGFVQSFVHGAFRPDGWGAPPVPRSFQALRLHDPDDGRSAVIGHFHGLRDPAGKGDSDARLAQARAAVAALGQVRLPGDPTVLAGDFNILPDSASFAVFAEAGLADLVTAHGHIDTRTSLYRKAGRHADYMLVSPEVGVMRFDVPAEPEVSDHRPMILEF